jgi:pilus assembly protein Flp/PilA
MVGSSSPTTPPWSKAAPMNIRWDREQGASAVEYSLIVVAIAAVIVAVVFAVGKYTEGNFGATCSELDSQMTVSASC